MQKLTDKIVFITGASSGIGKATAEQFAAQGAKLILTARRIDRLETVAKQLQKDYQVEILPLALDVQDKTAVTNVIEQLPKEWQAIDVLVNNAGLALGLDKVQNVNLDDVDGMIDTNIKGLLYMTRIILPGMIERGTGHIINVGSIAGREHYAGGAVYVATKHAVRAISKTLRMDILGLGVRVSEIAPGAVNTEFSTVRFKGDKEKADNVYLGFDPLLANDIAEAILFCATRPAHVNVSELEIYPTAQAGLQYHRVKKN